MENNIIHTSIKYEPNCHYNASANYEDIEAPLNDTTVTIDSVDWYCGDVATITAKIRDKNNNEVRWGNVIFYYINEEDHLQTEQKINTNPIPVNINGEASIKYMPYNDGKIIAKYNGSPYYKNNEYILPFILNPQPTITEFVKYSPLLVDEEETVVLEVDITDDYKRKNTDPTPVDYGIVTFLNYKVYTIEDPTSGSEKVIGNPAYVSNGKAKIRYSPIQLDDSSELLGNIELIRAVYNYDNNLYGVKWHYYAMSEDYISIAIKRDNCVNMLVPSISDGNNPEKAMTCDEEGMFVANESNTLICSCNIKAGGQDIDNAEVYFWVDGTKYEYTDNKLNKIDYIDSIKAEYNAETNKFIANISNIPQGFYQIYAKASNAKAIIGQKDGEDVWYYLPSKNTTQGDMPTTEKGIAIPDGLYLKDTQSESFFVRIYPLSNDLELTLDLDTQVVSESITENNITYNILKKENVRAHINAANITENDLTILNGKECYFHIPSLSIKQTGTIKRSGNELIASLGEDIKITTPGDYQLYAFIQGETYNLNNISIKYETTYSKPLTLKVRRDMGVSLEIKTPNIPAEGQIASDQYPGNIQYVVRAKNIGTDVLDVSIKVDGYEIARHFLSPSSLKATGQVPNTIENNGNTIDITSVTTSSSGPHIITAEIQNQEYASKKDQKSFNITKGNLIISLNNNSANTHTGDQSDIILGVENASGYKIGTIDENKFEATLIDNTNTPFNISNIKISQNKESVNDYYCTLICTASIYDEGQWKIKVNYTGDNNYNKTQNQDFLPFNAINFDPYGININYNKNMVTNQITYKTENETVTKEVEGQKITTEEIKYYGIDQYILIENTLIIDEKESSIKIKEPAITNIAGQYQLSPGSIQDESAWAQYELVKYKINPKHPILQTFKSISENNSTLNDQHARAVEAFNNYFDLRNTTSQYIVNNYNITPLMIQSLYDQAKRYKFKVLFLGYNEKEGEIGITYESD